MNLIKQQMAFEFALMATVTKSLHSRLSLEVSITWSTASLTAAAELDLRW